MTSIIMILSTSNIIQITLYNKANEKYNFIKIYKIKILFE